MWAEHERYKNHFLQIQLKHLEPQQINEIVNKERIKIQKCRKYSKDVCKYSNENCKSAFYLENRAALAYGFWALPKLLKELNSDDHIIMWRAIKSLSEYVKNPLLAQAALSHKTLAVLRRCQNVFLRVRKIYPRVKLRETEGLLTIFYYFSLYRNGAQQMLYFDFSLNHFYTMIYDRHRYMELASSILPHLSRDIANCLKLIDDNNVFDKLYNIFNKDRCISYYPNDLWLHLSHVLEQAPREGVHYGFFEILLQRISGRLYRYHIWDMKCFALLLRCPEGQQRFQQVDGIKLLYTIINQEGLDDFENVVFALMAGLQGKLCLWRCREFTNLPLLLISLAKDSLKIEQQLYCLQSLREMGVMPVIKRFIKENCLEDIRNLKCNTEFNEKERKEMVYWLEREIYHTKDLRNETATLYSCEM